MFKFITRQSFIVNLIIAIAFIFLLGVIFFLSLGWITNHGDYLKVPSVLGKPVSEAVKQLESNGFEVVITDSVYSDSLPLDIVKKQLPDPDATVKVNRTVFLNVNPSVLPMVEMPSLEGLSYRFAVDKLLKNHLKLGDTTYRANFMKGSVLEQRYQGDKIATGSRIRWGSRIDLVIGGGVEAQKIPVPDLIGMTVAEARDMLKQKGILLAAILTSGSISDTASAFIFRQNPDALTADYTTAYIQPGQTMDIWVQSTRPVISDSLRTDSLLKK